MTTIAIISDVHGNVEALRRAIEDARAQGVTTFVHLGDLGDGEAHEVLATVHPRSVVGNWEVSAWRTLPPRWREEVRQWPFSFHEGEAVFAHASPVWPREVVTLDDAMRYVEAHGSWFALFPALHQDEDARWDVYAYLQEHGARVLFHGHTHVQKAWAFTLENRERALSGPEISLEEGHLYIIGVGSVGRPMDGPGVCYALWDREGQCVRYRRL